MEIAIREDKGTIIIRPTGRLDASTSPDFGTQVGARIGDGSTNAVLDLSSLDYISSAGLRDILSLAKTLKAGGGALCLCGLAGLVQEVIALSGFDGFLPIEANVEAAIQKIAQP